MEYALPYIAISFIFGLLGLYSYSKGTLEIQSKINLLCIVLFLFFFGFRGFVFDDWRSYYPAFKECAWSDLSLLPSKSWSYECGFTLLILICKTIFNNYHFFVFICSLINTLLLVRFFSKRISLLPIGLILYISMGGLVMSTNLMRNSIAILIFINSLEFLEKRKPLPYFLLCILACSFHSSSVFYLPLYFFLHRNLGRWPYLFIFLLGNAILLLHISILTPIINIFGNDASDILLNKVQDYQDMETGGGFTISIGYLERLFTGILIFIYMDKLKEQRAENVIFINSILLYFLMIFMFSEFEEISKRMSTLYIYAYWIIWYDLIKTFSVMNNRRLFIIFIGIYCMLKIMGTARFVSAQYDNIFFGSKSYQERLFIYNRNIPDAK